MSAVILRFPRHAETLKPKATGSTRNPFLSSSAEIIRKFSGGIVPRARQLLTAGKVKPRSSAAAVVPPNASTMSSTDLSMPQDTSRSVKMSRVHAARMDEGRNVILNKEMDSQETIAGRLDLWLRTEKRRRRLTASKVCTLIGCAENAFSQYRGGDRPLPIEVADGLCMHFGLTLDWLYRGDPRSIDLDLQLAMQETVDQEQKAKLAQKGHSRRRA